MSSFEFVDVVWRSESNSLAQKPSEEKQKDPGSKFYKDWIHHASAQHSAPEQYVADELRKLHPNHSLVMTSDYRLHILGFPGVSSAPRDTSTLLTELFFVPLARRLGGPLGLVIDNVEVGSFDVTWEGYQFIVYITQWPLGFGSRTEYFILHEGSDEPVRELLVKVGIFADQLHDEIWVFDQGFWQKNHGLWQEIQKANWADVILKPEYKKAIQKDVFGFFSSQETYRQLSIPWKRGIIMHGPPGNGKTISLKAIMKQCDALGYAPLYVKSFQSWKGEEGAMSDVFEKARQTSPSVVILEDLDSLINDRNRSFFLNQLDGLEGNDGLLVIGTTNHFDRLDPGLSTRPSRFDRKFLFDDPDQEERALYAKYWQQKLSSNKDIDFPDSLVDEIAAATTNFSFAYLKEAFVSTLVTLAGLDDDEKGVFSDMLKAEIKTLRKQLDKPSLQAEQPPAFPPTQDAPVVECTVPHPTPGFERGMRDVRGLLDTLSDHAGPTQPSRSYLTTTSTLPGAFQVGDSNNDRERDVRPLLDGLAQLLARKAIQDAAQKITDRTYVTRPSAPSPNPQQHATRDGRTYEWANNAGPSRSQEANRNAVLNPSERIFTGGDYFTTSLGKRL
ncbi:hypothetical protein ONZ45_g9995 [Pleurotus djamor]|nr:hypothetical protein ONZ45_g9995 [Pleurotus djamor]